MIPNSLEDFFGQFLAICLWKRPQKCDATCPPRLWTRSGESPPQTASTRGSRRDVAGCAGSGHNPHLVAGVVTMCNSDLFGVNSLMFFGDGTCFSDFWMCLDLLDDILECPSFQL